MSSQSSADRFRRLARSSPWLWHSLEFRWRIEPDHVRHAWIRRPGSLRVEDESGSLLEASSAGRPHAGTMVYSSDGTSKPMQGRWPSEIHPTCAEDGLVESVPDHIDVDYDHPFYEDYHWVAMLNPIELADRVHDRDDRPARVPVELHEITRVEHHGRPAWQAMAQPTPAYDPRCDCCPLLAGEFDNETDLWSPGPPSLVRIDEQTGVCVTVEGTAAIELDMEILAVDQPLDDELFTRPRRRWFRR